MIADALTVSGTMVIAAASSAGTTQLWNSSTSGSTWNPFGVPITGTVVSLGANATNSVVVTVASSGWAATAFGLGGVEIGQATLAPAGSGATGILSASATFVASGLGSLVAIAFSVGGSNQVQMVTSTNGGTSYSSPLTVGLFSSTQPNPALSSLGDSELASPGWIAGQLGLVSFGSGLFLAYPSLTAGQLDLFTESSGNGGQTWQGPFESGPVSGGIHNLSVTASIAGLAYATWANPGWGTGGVEEAIFFADGSPLLSPSPIPGAGGAGPGLTGAPSLAVDSFQRPLIAWPVSNGTARGIAFTGDFLTANQSLAQVNQMVNDPLVGGDFPSGGGSSQQAAFNASVANAVSLVSTSLSTNKLCNAQNATALSLYQNVTHLPLSIIPGSGTVCSSKLTPNNLTSPIANTVGVNAPNTYLAVYSDWLLESLGVPLGVSPLVNATNQWGPSATPAPTPLPLSKITNFTGNPGCLPGLGGWSQCGTQENVAVLPFLYSPTALNLAVTAGFPSSSYSTQWKTCGKVSPPRNGGEFTYTANYTVVKTWTNVSINNGTVHSFTGTGFYPSPYVSNLTPSTSFYWSVTLSPLYQLQISGTWCGTGSAPSAPFTASKTTFSGVVKTTLAFGFTSYSWHTTYTSKSNNAPVSLSFASSANMGVVGNVTITDNSNGGVTVARWTSWPPGWYLPATQGGVGFTGVVGHTYQATVWSTSRPGGWTSAQVPSFSYSPPVKAPAQTVSWSFSFTLTRPSITVWGWQVSNITATTAQLTWLANFKAAGFVTYSTEGGGSNLTISGMSGTALSNGTSWRFTVELHGLEPWAFYQGTYGVVASTKTYTYSVSQAFSPFQTAAALVLWESDNLYDSITNTGGGAEFHWSLPPAVAESNPAAKVSGGTLTIWNATQALVIPVSPSEINTTPRSPWFNTLNVTLAALNSTYGAALQLNYTGSPAFSAYSQNYAFTYQKDSSGDGLTDLEKENGWEITSTGTWGTVSYPVYASPSLYSTNGLVSDYYEKAYGLNPLVVDTAGSHMLDMWNLTFDLGSSSAPVSIPDSSAFHLWWENNTTFYPFNFAPYPNDPSWGGKALAKDISNISCTATNCPGNSPYSSEVLWSGQALTTFLNMPGVINSVTGSWLRGVVSIAGTNRTLTLWGKLSWGANPLVNAALGNGVPDGARVNPLLSQDLEISFGEGGAELSSGSCSGVPSGSAYALRMWVNGSAASPVTELAGAYSQEVGVSGGSCGAIYSGNPVVWTFPVDNQVQFQRVTIQIVLNTSTPGLVPVNGSSTSVVIPIDMLNPPPLTACTRAGCSSWFEYFGSSSTYGTYSDLEFGITAVPAGAKTPTYLWLPPGNATLSSLPAGLQRYTGAQNFALLLVNASATQQVYNIPTPWGSTYSVTLSSGLNNILIPMVALSNSPLGDALFLNKVAADSSQAVPPMLQTAQAGGLIDGSGTASLSDLACYWQNRAVSSSSSVTPLCSAHHSADKGSSVGSGLRMMLLNATPSSCIINCGTVPTNPSVESGADALPALGVLVALNITNTSMVYALLAGILDNSSGGVNGTFEALQPYQIATLGLPSVVLNAMANVSAQNTPIFGPPKANLGAQHQDSCSGWLGCAAQTWNSLAGDVVSGFTVVAAFVWSATIVSVVFWANLVVAAASLYYEYVIQPTISTIERVGSVIVGALNALLNYIISLVKAALAAVINPIVNAAESFDSALGAATNASVADVAGGGSVTIAHAMAWAHSFDEIALIGSVLGSVIAIVITLTAPFELGANFLLGLIVGLLPTVASQLISGFPFGMATLTQSAVTALESSLGTPLSATAWTAVAELVGIAAPSGDFLFSLIKASENNFPEAVALSFFTTIIVEVIVVLFNVATWFIHVSAMVITALILAGFAGGLAAVEYPKYSAFPELATFASLSRILGIAGFGAACADFVLAGG